MSQIDKLRKQIDKIDFQILDLLKKRSKIAENIGKEKNQIIYLDLNGRQVF